MGDRGCGDAAAFLEMEATGVGVAAAVRKGDEVGAGGAELVQRIGCAVGEVDDTHRAIRLSSRCSVSRSCKLRIAESRPCSRSWKALAMHWLPPQLLLPWLKLLVKSFRAQSGDRFLVNYAEYSLGFASLLELPPRRISMKWAA